MTYSPPIPFKTWRYMKAEQLCLTPKTFHANLYRGRVPWPEVIRKHRNHVDVLNDDNVDNSAYALKRLKK